MKTAILKKTIASLLTIAFFAAMSLQAKAQCQAGFTFTVNTNTVTFTNTSVSTGNPNYYWSFGAGFNIISMNPPTIVYSLNGPQGICLSLYDSLNAGCFSTFCDTISITGQPNPPCSVGFVYTSDSSNKNAIQFYNQTSNTPVSWTWDFGDGNTSTLQNPSHAYATPGNYTVCHSMVNSFQDTCSFCKTITYAPCTFTAGFSANTSNDPQVVFTNTSTGGVGPYYYWVFGDNSIFWGQTPAPHTYQYSGTYTIELFAYDSLSYCTDIFTDSIVILNAPPQPCTAYFGYQHDSLLNNGTYNFSGYTNTNSTAAAWAWDFGDGQTSNLQNPVHQYTVFGSFQICLTVTTTVGTVCTNCMTMQINNPGSCSAAITLVQDTINPLLWYLYPVVTGTAPFNYHWIFGDGGTANYPNPSHTYANPGNYLICLTITDANGCSSSSCDSAHKITSGIMQYVVVVNSTNGVEELSVSHFSVYPNPAHRSTTISYTLEKNSAVQISLYDRIGTKVAELANGNVTAGPHQLEWNAENLSEGIYFLEVKANNSRTTSKLVLIK